MKEVKFDECANDILKQLPQGAFLNVKDKDGNVNTMTIGWGSIGWIWRKPIFTALVRHSRHTFGLIENADSFVVSFPFKDELKDELGFCGTKSGRAHNKFKEAQLTPKSCVVNSPIIEECEFNVECKILYKEDMNKSNMLDSEIKGMFYPKDDYHMIYYGEIISCKRKLRV